MSVTQATLLQDLVREYNLGRAGTATSATTTQLVDASNFGGATPGSAFANGDPIRITSGAAAGGNSTKSAAIDPSTGTITFSPSVTGNTGTPTFIISNVVEHNDRIVEALNRSLQRRCSRRFKVPLTDVPDGDFLGALNGGAVTDHWDPTNATSAYLNLAFPDGFSARGIAVTTTAINGFVRSDVFPTHPGSTRYFMGFAKGGPSQTAQFTLIDATNNVTITPTYDIGSDTTDSASFVVVKGSYVVPDTCSAVAWGLGAQESVVTVVFGPMLDVERGQTTFATQPHLNSEDDIGQWWVGTVREIGAITNPGPETIAYNPWVPDGLSFDDYGWGQGVFFQSAPQFPTWYEEYGFYPALADDADTTDAPEALVLCGAAVELYEMLVSGNSQTPGYYRGKPLPTATVLKLQQAREKWNSGFMQRLRAGRTVSIKRTSNIGVWA